MFPGRVRAARNTLRFRRPPLPPYGDWGCLTGLQVVLAGRQVGEFYCQTAVNTYLGPKAQFPSRAPLRAPSGIIKT